MRRDVLVVLVIAIAAVVVLVSGIYLLLSRTPPSKTPSGPGNGPSMPEWTTGLEKGLTYSRPVIGPTTPLNDADGGLWVINAAREGIIEMNLTGMRLAFNENPFRIANHSVRLDIAKDFAETATPLEAVYYIVPATDYAINGTTGPATQNGGIAFFAGSDFVAADPFNQTVFFRYTLAFTPTWTGEDPASAGDMLIAPRQLSMSVGLFSYPVGPYRYLWASDGSHTVVFEVTYVHAGYCPCAPPSGRVLLFANATLSAPPFVYYNEFGVSATAAYRTGPGAAIVLPLANQTLEIFDTVPSVRGWIPLTFAGQPASVVGTVGFVQSPYPYRLLLSLRSSSATGVAALDLSTLTTTFEAAVGGASLEPIGTAMSRNGQSTYLAWYRPADGNTTFSAVNVTGAPIALFSATVPGKAQSVFYVNEASEVFAQAPDGRIATLETTPNGTTNVTPKPFPLDLPSPDTVVLYAGSPGGTKFGSLLSSQEVRGAWTSNANATTALFQLLPSISGAAIPVASSASLGPPGTLGIAALLAVPAAVTAGRRTSCSARACGPRPSCRRTRA